MCMMLVVCVLCMLFVCVSTLRSYYCRARAMQLTHAAHTQHQFETGFCHACVLPRVVFPFFIIFLKLCIVIAFTRRARLVKYNHLLDQQLYIAIITKRITRRVQQQVLNLCVQTINIQITDRIYRTFYMYPRSSFNNMMLALCSPR